MYLSFFNIMIDFIIYAFFNKRKLKLIYGRNLHVKVPFMPYVLTVGPYESNSDQ